MKHQYYCNNCKQFFDNERYFLYHICVSDETIAEVAAVSRSNQVHEATGWLDDITMIDVLLYTKKGQDRRLRAPPELQQAIIDSLREIILKKEGLNDD